MQSTAQNTKQKRRKRLRKAVNNSNHSIGKGENTSLHADSDDGLAKISTIKTNNKLEKLSEERKEGENVPNDKDLFDDDYNSDEDVDMHEKSDKQKNLNNFDENVAPNEGKSKKKRLDKLAIKVAKLSKEMEETKQEERKIKKKTKNYAPIVDEDDEFAPNPKDVMAELDNDSLY
jgi:hypothetical protein